MFYFTLGCISSVLFGATPSGWQLVNQMVCHYRLVAFVREVSLRRSTGLREVAQIVNRNLYFTVFIGYSVADIMCS